MLLENYGVGPYLNSESFLRELERDISRRLATLWFQDKISKDKKGLAEVYSYLNRRITTYIEEIYAMVHDNPFGIKANIAFLSDPPIYFPTTNYGIIHVTPQYICSHKNREERITLISFFIGGEINFWKQKDPGLPFFLLYCLRMREYEDTMVKKMWNKLMARMDRNKVIKDATLHFLGFFIGYLDNIKGYKPKEVEKEPILLEAYYVQEDKYKVVQWIYHLYQGELYRILYLNTP